MRYLVMMYAEESGWGGLSAEEQQHYFDAHAGFDQAVRSRASMVAGEALGTTDTATTLRHVDGTPVLTDGPFAETAEQLGGFYLVDAPDLDVMTELCALLPHTYTVEVRPVVVIEGYDPAG